METLSGGRNENIEMVNMLGRQNEKNQNIMDLDYA